MGFYDNSLLTGGSTGGTYTGSNGGTYTWVSDPTWAPGGVPMGGYYKPAATTSPLALPPATVAASTGVNPVETSYSLYGHIIPLSVFGVGRIGGEIISGPWISNGKASFIISFGVPADPTGTRTLREIAFDSEVVWTAASGFLTEAFTYRFYGGTLTQSVDALETTNFGADAVAYRPQILLAIENLPLANTKFKKIPYVAAVIADATGDDINLGEAFSRLATSPWVGFTSSQFATSGITDGLVSGGLIFAQDTDFLSAIQQFGRFYRSWDILQTDKLRIVDRGPTVAPDITLDKTRLMGPVTMTRAEPNTVPKDLELTTIDPNADYTLVPSRESDPRAPVNVSTSVTTESAYLPAIMDASTRQAMVTYAKYADEQGKKTITGTAMTYGLQMEPGDLVAITGLGADFYNETYKIIETLHGANYSVEFTAQSFLKCNIESDPYFYQVVLLTGFEDGASGTTTVRDQSPAANGVANVHGNAQIDSSQQKYGVSSGKFDGSGDHFDWPPSSNWNLGTVWTIELFARFNATTSDMSLAGQWNGIGIGSQHAWMLRTQPSGVIEFLTYNGSTFDVQIDSPTSAYTTGQWYHIAVDSNGTKVRLYINGIMVASQTPTTTLCGQPIVGVILGDDFLNGRSFNGWLDEVRITAGLARYNTDTSFTVPAAAFPRT